MVIDGRGRSKKDDTCGERLGRVADLMTECCRRNNVPVNSCPVWQKCQRRWDASLNRLDSPDITELQYQAMVESFRSFQKAGGLHATVKQGP
jgi:hypothetical protein